MAEETKPQKTKRELFGERLKAKYPDREYADDEALFGQIGDDYDAYEKQLGDFRDREGRLSELFRKDHNSAQFITDMARGEDPWIAVIKRLGIDGVTDILNDPEKEKAYAEANKAYTERLVKEDEYKDLYFKNFAESMDMLDNLQKELGIDDDTLDAAMALIDQITIEAVAGKFKKETVEMALKAVMHDADVEGAHEEGAVAGRNAKIKEQLAKQKRGDGLPAMAGNNNAPSAKKKEMNIFDLADAAR